MPIVCVFYVRVCVVCCVYVFIVLCVYVFVDVFPCVVATHSLNGAKTKYGTQTTSPRTSGTPLFSILGLATAPPHTLSCTRA